MKLTLAQTRHAEAIADFYRAVHDASFPHQEMLSGSTVEALLRDGELVVVIASVIAIMM